MEKSKTSDMQKCKQVASGTSKQAPPENCTKVKDWTPKKK